MYDRNLASKMDQLPTAALNEVLGGTVKHDEVKVHYSTNKEFESMAKKFEIMSDLRVKFHCSAWLQTDTFPPCRVECHGLLTKALSRSCIKIIREFTWYPLVHGKGTRLDMIASKLIRSWFNAIFIYNDIFMNCEQILG